MCGKANVKATLETERRKRCDGSICAKAVTVYTRSTFSASANSATLIFTITS